MCDAVTVSNQLLTGCHSSQGTYIMGWLLFTDNYMLLIFSTEINRADGHCYENCHAIFTLPLFNVADVSENNAK